MATPTGILFSDPQAKPFSASGLQQAGCYALFFVTGGTTPATVYADGFLSVPLTQVPGAAQPSCTADGSGLFNAIYLDPSVIYHVQMFTSLGVKFRDVDPYVPLPVPASVQTLISNVAALTSQITALNTEIATLQASYPWANITGVPAPLVSLGASTPPDTGTTFWRDDGTWASPSSVGQSVTIASTTDTTAIGSTPTTVINGLPVNAGHTYAMLFEGDIVSTGANSLVTAMVSNTAAALTQVGNGISWIANFVNQDFFSFNGNAAVPGITHSIHSGSDTYIRAWGRFTVPTGVTSVSYQMSVPSGSIVSKAGSYITLTQIS
jgi:hypothetical protein